MTETEGSGTLPRYCTGCGAQVRSGDSFCTSCGARLASGSQGAKRGGSSAAARPAPPNASLGDTFQTAAQRLRTPQALSGDALQGSSGDLLRRVKNLPLALKIVIGVVGALLLLTVLSPLGLLAALLLFGASLIGLVVRARQRRSVKGWGMVAVASLILLFMFGGISNALYGGELVGLGRGGPSPLEDLSPSTRTVPYYEIPSTTPDISPNDRYDMAFVTVRTRAVSHDELTSVVEDIGAQTRGGRYDFLNVRLCNPEQFGVGGRSADQCNRAVAAATISHSQDGQIATSVREGSYRITYN